MGIICNGATYNEAAKNGIAEDGFAGGGLLMVGFSTIGPRKMRVGDDVRW